MLADPRADALVSNFAGQWLFLRELKNARPDSPDFDGNLRQSFQRETELLFRAVVREDRSIIDLLDADFTFVDERLARHYGIPDIHGSRIRRIALPEDSVRRGLLGHGSILTVTSAANRTSPVVRGKWILDNLLGAPPPQPPPGVETNLEKEPEQVKVTSLRQRLEQHRANPVCASCHKMMDPIGFSLENFDHTGKWRTEDGEGPHRCLGSARGRHAARRPRHAPPRAARTRRCVRHGGGREDAHLRRGTGGAAPGHAGGAVGCARSGEGQVPVLVARAGRREQRPVPDADEGRQRPTVARRRR